MSKLMSKLLRKLLRKPISKSLRDCLNTTSKFRKLITIITVIIGLALALVLVIKIPLLKYHSNNTIITDINKIYKHNNIDNNELSTNDINEISTNDIETSNTINYNDWGAKEINYKEIYKQDEQYLVLFTHEKCVYCMELWFESVQKYLKQESIPIYVVDLAEKENMYAWEDYKIEGIPMLMHINKLEEPLQNSTEITHEGKIRVDKFIGLKEIKEMLKGMQDSNDNNKR